MDYSQKFLNVAFTVIAFFSLTAFFLKDYLSKLNQSWKKKKFERRKKEIYQMLLDELLSGRKWINDYSYENISRHGRTAQLLGIISHYHTPYDLYTYSPIDIAENLGLLRYDQPTIQWGLCIEICKRLDVYISKNFIKRRLWNGEWEMIAEKIGVKEFKKSYGKDLPIPFIMHAFCELYPYLNTFKN